MSAPTMTPQLLFDQLVRELSASGSTPLVDTETGQKLTLRDAVGALLWKQTFCLTLSGRPVAPTTADDQYGHTLSAHAIALQNQALLAAVAEKLGGIDVPSILASAVASFA